MEQKRIRFGKFEFPRISGLEYLFDEEKGVTDYLFINGPQEIFSMYFENDFPIFTMPEESERPYCLFEIQRPGKVIKFFCPEKHKNIDFAVWYFYVELIDELGVPHRLPGQVRVRMLKPCIRMINHKRLKFVEVLEGVSLSKTAGTV